MEPWTEREQALLEQGLVKFAALCDVKEKWKAIAQHVQTRDVRACTERFKVCRQRALEQAKEEEVRQEAPRESHGDWGGWSEEEWREWNSWKEWQESPEDEAERRKWEVQQDIEALRDNLLIGLRELDEFGPFRESVRAR